MPLDGEQLDDLLSGFVDGELTDEERALVEEAARGDARLGEQLKQLRQQSSWVQQAGSAIANDLSASSKSLPSGPSLAERVISAAKQRGREMGLPASHYVQPFAADHNVVECSPAAGRSDLVSSQTAGPGDGTGKSSFRRSVGWGAIVGLASAAALLIAVTWPRWQPDQAAKSLPRAALDNAVAGSLDTLANDSLTEDNSLDGTTNESDAVGSGLVGKSAGMSYALVVDVEMTAAAQRSHVLEKILATAGIPLVPPIAANPEILKALDDSRMIVRNSVPTARQLSIQVVRGDMQELDIALRQVWQDSNHFPHVALNLSIDSRATLVREILRSAGNRFTPTDRFAVPLAVDRTATVPQSTDLVDPASGQASPFLGADGGVQYISKSQRDSGWGGMVELPGAQRDSMATILLVMHRVD
ncbi:MAG: zf-HC2 domain-containing protein [Planctomycetales bacterium]|nr:zf-HC2 domain-containing protein [Planctomycetales bacterium]